MSAMVGSYWDRLKPALDAHRMSVSALADALGITYQAVKKVRDGGDFGSTNNLRAARLLGLNPEWLATGTGPRTGTGAPPVAHPVSHSPRRIEAIRFTWGEIAAMDTGQLGDLFISAMPDDSAAPDFPAGTEIEWSTRKPHQPGSLVLVRDEHGTLHARECRQGHQPGTWIAAAINRAYASFDSPQITLIAVGARVLRALP